MKVFKGSNIKFYLKNWILSTFFKPQPLCFFSEVKSETIDISPLSEETKQPPTKKPKEIKINRFALSPHAFWLTQGKGMERPFTGDYWFTKDTGHYECVTCSKKLFL